MRNRWARSVLPRCGITNLRDPAIAFVIANLRSIRGGVVRLAENSLGLVNDQPITIGIAKGRPPANLCFSRSQKERNRMIVQVLHCCIKVFDFKGHRHTVGRNRPVRIRFDCKRSCADIIFDTVRDLDLRPRLASIPASLRKRRGRGSCR